MSRALVYVLAAASTLAWHLIRPLWDKMDKECWSNSQVNWTIAGILIACYIVIGTAICVPWWRCGQRGVKERSILIDQEPAREVFELRVYKDVG